MENSTSTYKIDDEKEQLELGTLDNVDRAIDRVRTCSVLASIELQVQEVISTSSFNGSCTALLSGSWKLS
jgi:hypothetical protein